MLPPLPLAADDVTAGAMGAAADAATAGAAEPAAARSGHAKRHVDDVTPGEALGTRARAREWTESDDEDDAGMSVEEEEAESAAEDSDVEQAVGVTRAKWVKDDVALLRDADLIGRKKHNAHDCEYAHPHVLSAGVNIKG